MEPETESAIRTLTKKAEQANEPVAALQLTQAALNLAQTEATLSNTRREEGL